MPLRLRLESASVRREMKMNSDLGCRAKRLCCGPETASLSVDALLMDFEDASVHRYRSRLSVSTRTGWKWATVAAGFFQSFPDGRYRLEIIGASAEGDWSEPVQMDIQVLPPVWKSGWAIVIYIFGILMTLAMTFELSGANEA